MSLLQMSVSGGALVLVIVIVRVLALYRLPKETFLTLWKIAVLRLLLPVSIPLPFSVFAQMEHLLGVSGYMTGKGRLLLGQTMIGHLSVPAVRQSIDPYAICAVIWLTGMSLMAAYFIIFYVRNSRKFKASTPDRTSIIQKWLSDQRLSRPLEVRQSDQISSPLTYGIFHPVILLPKKMERGDETALTYILTHEYVHIRRFDALTKLCFAAALCVHWFNPFVWMMYVLANRDLELSCDARVIYALGGKEKASYALTLLSMAERKMSGFSLHSHFSRYALEERIETIMKYKKASILTVILSLALVVGITTAFAAGGGDSTESKQEYYGVDHGANNDTNEIGMQVYNTSSYTECETTLIPMGENTYLAVTPDGEVIAACSYPIYSAQQP